MPKPCHEALVAQEVDGRLVGGEVEEDDLGVLGLVAQRAVGPLADQLAGLAVVGGEGRVGRIHRIERRVEHDDHEPGVARLLDGRHDRLGVATARWQSPWRRPRSGFDRRDLAVIVAVELAGGGAISVDAELLRLGLAPSRILTKKGLVSVLVIRPTMSAAWAEVADRAPSAAAPATRNSSDSGIYSCDLLPVEQQTRSARHRQSASDELFPPDVSPSGNTRSTDAVNN